MLQPLFKWAGGKSRMREKYGLEIWPDRDFTLFIDAFYGAGSVTHWVADKHPNVEFIINDANSELITLYRNLRDNTDWFCEKVAELEHDYLKIPYYDKVARMAYYNKCRMTYVYDYKDMKSTDESATLYFMMKICFNGWWKTYVFSKGRYATCCGTVKERVGFVNYQLLRETAKFFNERVREIRTGDFATVREFASSDAYLYFDPPYRDSFGYGEAEFDDGDHLRMCEVMRHCDDEKASVSMSNREIGDDFWHQNLPGFEILEYDATYTASIGPTTIDAREVLVRNFKSEVSSLERLFG